MVWDQEVGGSNPLARQFNPKNLQRIRNAHDPHFGDETSVSANQVVAAVHLTSERVKHYCNARHVKHFHPSRLATVAAHRTPLRLFLPALRQRPSASHLIASGSFIDTETILTYSARI